MLRAYNDSDLDALLAVWRRASCQAHPFLEEAFLIRERKNIVKVYMPLARTWVYEREGEVVGFLSLIENEIGAIFVDPDAQGQGIGRKLMDHARALHEELVLDVFKANAIGRRFYDRYGFVTDSEYVHEPTGETMLRLRIGAR